MVVLTGCSIWWYVLCVYGDVIPGLVLKQKVMNDGGGGGRCGD